MKNSTLTKWVGKVPSLRRILTEKLTHSFEFKELPDLITDFQVGSIGKKIGGHTLKCEAYDDCDYRQEYTQERLFIVLVDGSILEHNGVESIYNSNYNFHRVWQTRHDSFKEIFSISKFIDNNPQAISAIYVKEKGYYRDYESYESDFGWKIKSLEVKLFFL